MGKYIKKPKATGDNYTVTVTDVFPPSLGVRTRAKTLALQKLNSTTAPATSEQHRRGLSYLQLRSRRLEKPQLTCCRRQNPNPRLGNCPGGDELVGSGLIETRLEETEDDHCFGENNIDIDGRERTRESTPCSLIKDVNAITTPGSGTRSRILKASNRINQNSDTRSVPFAQEIEEFFALHDQQEQQRRFAHKYNFDIVNEKPLEGCYEWRRVESQ